MFFFSEGKKQAALSVSNSVRQYCSMLYDKRYSRGAGRFTLRLELGYSLVYAVGLCQPSLVKHGQIFTSPTSSIVVLWLCLSYPTEI